MDEAVGGAADKVTVCLDAALRDAHVAGDGERLARLYTRAADEAEGAGDIDAACFFLTHAWVFALQAGAAGVEAIEHRLVGHGRLRTEPRADPGTGRGRSDPRSAPPECRLRRAP